MNTRRTMQWLSLALVVPFLGGATEAATTEAATPDAAGSSAAGCTITIKAFLKPGAFGKDGVTLLLGDRVEPYGGGSRVRIKSGTWSRLGNSRYRRIYFHSDGKWRERDAHSPGKTGTGRWTGQLGLNMGCRYNRRYEFRIRRESSTGTPVAQVRPQYPSASAWTRSQTIDLGNLAQYF